MGPGPRRHPAVGASRHADPRSRPRPDRLGALRAAHQRQLPQVVPPAAALERRDAVREVRRRRGRAPGADRRDPGREPRPGVARASRSPACSRSPTGSTSRRRPGSRAAAGRSRRRRTATDPGDGCWRDTRPSWASCWSRRTCLRDRTAATAGDRAWRPAPVRRRPRCRARARLARARRRGPARLAGRGRQHRPDPGHQRHLHRPADPRPGPRRRRDRRPQPPRRDPDAQVLLRPRVPRRAAGRQRVRDLRGQGRDRARRRAVEGRDAAADRLRRAAVRRRRPIARAHLQPRRSRQAAEPPGPGRHRPRDVPGLGVRLGRGEGQPRPGPLPGRLRRLRGERRLRQPHQGDRRRGHAVDAAARRAADVLLLPHGPARGGLQGVAAAGRRGRAHRRPRGPRLARRPGLGRPHRRPVPEGAAAADPRDRASLARDAGDRGPGGREPGGRRLRRAVRPGRAADRGRLLGRPAGRAPRGRARLVQRRPGRGPMGQRGVRVAVRAASGRKAQGPRHEPEAHRGGGQGRDPAQRLAEHRRRRRRGRPPHGDVRVRGLPRARPRDRGTRRGRRPPARLGGGERTRRRLPARDGRRVRRRRAIPRRSTARPTGAACSTCSRPRPARTSPTSGASG